MSEILLILASFLAIYIILAGTKLSFDSFDKKMESKAENMSLRELRHFVQHDWEKEHFIMSYTLDEMTKRDESILVSLPHLFDAFYRRHFHYANAMQKVDTFFPEFAHLFDLERTKAKEGKQTFDELKILENMIGAIGTSKKLVSELKILGRQEVVEKLGATLLRVIYMSIRHSAMDAEFRALVLSTIRERWNDAPFSRQILTCTLKKLPYQETIELIKQLQTEYDTSTSEQASLEDAKNTLLRTLYRPMNGSLGLDIAQETKGQISSIQPIEGLDTVKRKQS